MVIIESMNSLASFAPIIGVIGGSSCTKEVYALAEEVGRLIARSGASLICGGMGGVMEAVCKGAFNAGGLTIGILPSDNTSTANPFVRVPVSTGMGIGRNIIIVRTARSFIAIDGKYGTLSEIAFALQLGKPVIALQTWLEVPGIKVVETAAEAVKLALQ